MRKKRRTIAALLLAVVFCLSGNGMALAAQPPAQTETEAEVQSKEGDTIAPEDEANISADDKTPPPQKPDN